MSLNHIKLGAHGTSICGHEVVKFIFRYIFTCQTKQNKTDKRPKSSAVVNLKFVGFNHNFYTNSAWRLANISGPSKLVGVKEIAINLKQVRTKMYCSHQNCISYKVYGFFPKGNVHRHVFKREASKTAVNVNDEQNQSFPDKENLSQRGLLLKTDRQEEDEGASMRNVNQPLYDMAVLGLSDYFQKNCEHGLNSEASKATVDKIVTKPFKIYNKVTSNLDDLFPKIETGYDININENDEHATKIKKVPHLRVKSSNKNSLMPINNELRPNLQFNQDHLKDKQTTEEIKKTEKHKSRGRRCLLKQAFSLPSSDEQNIRFDDVHFSKDLEPKSEIATRLFGQESTQQNTQLNMPLPTPSEVIPIKEKLLELNTEFPTKMKLCVEEATMQKQRITIPNPDKQNMRFDDLHFNKNLEPKSEVAKRLFEQESALQNTQLNMPLETIFLKENILELGTKSSTEMNLSVEEAERLKRQLLASNEKTYINNIPVNKLNLEKHKLSIRYERHKDKCTLTQKLQTLMSSTSNKSYQHNELDSKPEFQLEKPIHFKASKSSNSELINKLSNSRSSHLHYTQNPRKITLKNHL